MPCNVLSGVLCDSMYALLGTPCHFMCALKPHVCPVPVCSSCMPCRGMLCIHTVKCCNFMYALACMPCNPVLLVPAAAQGTAAVAVADCCCCCCCCSPNTLLSHSTIRDDDFSCCITGHSHRLEIEYLLRFMLFLQHTLYSASMIASRSNGFW